MPPPHLSRNAPGPPDAARTSASLPSQADWHPCCNAPPAQSSRAHCPSAKAKGSRPPHQANPGYGQHSRQQGTACPAPPDTRQTALSPSRMP